MGLSFNHCRRIAIFVAAWGVIADFGFAQTTPLSTTKSAPSPQVVILKNGNAIAGTVESELERVAITSGPGRRVRVPMVEVDFIANDWREAFQIQRSRIAFGDFDRSYKLAQWCLRHDQVALASEFYSELAERYPQERRLRSIEVALDARAKQILAAPNPTATVARTVHEEMLADGPLESFVETEMEPVVIGERPATTEAVTPAGAETLPGNALTPAMLSEFARIIQPMLHHRCGQVGCHGGSVGGSFTLVRVPNGRTSRKDIVLRNLRAAMGQLDLDDVDSSPLLTHAETAHGTTPRAPFDAREIKQRNRLRSWANAVVSGAAPNASALAEPRTSGNSPAPLEAPGAKPLPQATVTSSAASNLGVATTGTVQPVDPSPSEEGEDAYDPAAFNARWQQAAETLPSPPTSPQQP